MSCPDPLRILERPPAPEVAAHLADCPRCAAFRAESAALEAALLRLRDPAPPPDLIAGAWRRIDAAEQRVPLWAALGALLCVCAAGLTLVLLGAWRPLAFDVSLHAVAATDLARLLLAPFAAVPFAVAAPCLAVVLGAALMLHRLLAAASERF